MLCRYGKLTVSGDGLYRAEEDKPAYFYIDTHGMEGTPEVRVEGQLPSQLVSSLWLADDLKLDLL